jgi:hypothetical protein
MRNKMTDLRNHLFATLEELTDKDNPMEVNRANAIAGVAGVIVNAVKVEIQARRQMGLKPTEFVDSEENLTLLD